VAAAAGAVAVFCLATASAASFTPPLGACSGSQCPATWPPVNNGDFVGRDASINVFAGGDMRVVGRAAESEGKVVVLGSLDVAKDGGGVYNMGVAGVGSRVPPPNDTDFVSVGGTTTVREGDRILVGGSDSKSVATGDFRHAGRLTGIVEVVRPGMVVQDPAAVTPYLGLRTEIENFSTCIAEQAATGTVKEEFGTVRFTGDGKSAVQVFNVTRSIGEPGRMAGIEFTGIPDGATVLVNMLGDAPLINTYTGSGLPGDQLTGLRPTLLWNFPTATSATIAGSAQFQGSVLAGNPSGTTTISQPGVDGRVYLAGNLVHTGTAGTEIHSYPFTGTLPDCISTGQPTSTPTRTNGVNTATASPTPTGSTQTPSPTKSSSGSTTPTPSGSSSATGSTSGPVPSGPSAQGSMRATTAPGLADTGFDVTGPSGIAALLAGLGIGALILRQVYRKTSRRH
jgi:choice-of-anchor A domain-containing protein